ncbi:pyridoxamine 5'-phosphate oxidase family protein [Nocardia tengchongensis]|uniref:pyridoxamine 5'-phosphate oxidase family protein n=1 Tax=Nocardia tengchongensis TaxID=2055889 RepID=UPI003650688F
MSGAAHELDDESGCDTVKLGRQESLRLLAGAAYGRVVFSHQALPAIRPVNHLLDDGMIIIRTRLSAQLAIIVRADGGTGEVVAYEADELDPILHTGWSVVVTGFARSVTDPTRVARYRRLLRPWVNKTMNAVIEIEPKIVTGIRLVPHP